MINKQKSFLRASLFILVCMLLTAPVEAKQEPEQQNQEEQNQTEQKNQTEPKIEFWELDLPLSKDLQQMPTEQLSQEKKSTPEQNSTQENNNLYPPLEKQEKTTTQAHIGTSLLKSTSNQDKKPSYEVTPRMLIHAFLLTCSGIALIFALSRLLQQPPSTPIQSFIINSSKFPQPIVQPINATHNHVTFYGSTYIR